MKTEIGKKAFGLVKEPLSNNTVNTEDKLKSEDSASAKNCFESINNNNEQKLVKTIETITEKLNSDPDNYMLLCNLITLNSKLCEMRSKINDNRDNIMQSYNNLENLRKKTLFLYSFTEDMLAEWVKDISQEFKFNYNMTSKSELTKCKEYRLRVFYVYENALKDFYYSKILKKYVSLLKEEVNSITEQNTDSSIYSNVIEILDPIFFITSNDFSESIYNNFLEQYIDLLILFQNKLLNNFVSDDFIRDRIKWLLTLPRKNYQNIVNKYLLWENTVSKSQLKVEDLIKSYNIKVLDEQENQIKLTESTNIISELSKIISKTKEEKENITETNETQAYDSAPVMRFLNKTFPKVNSLRLFYLYEICLRCFFKDNELWINYLNKLKEAEHLFIEHGINNYIVSQFKRATKFCFQDSKLWIMYFRELEFKNTPLEKIILEIEIANNSFSEPSFKYQIVKFKLEYLCRNYQNNKEYLDFFRSSYNNILNEFILQNEENDLNTIIIKLASIVMEFECYTVFDINILQIIFFQVREKINFENKEIHLEHCKYYINMIKHFNNKDVIRNTYLRLINDFKDEVSEDIYQLWIGWEKIFGTPKTVIEALDYKSTNKQKVEFTAKKRIKFSDDKNNLSDKICNKSKFLDNTINATVNNLNNTILNEDSVLQDDQEKSYITPKTSKSKSKIVNSYNDNSKIFTQSSSIKYEIKPKSSIGISNLLLSSRKDVEIKLNNDDNSQDSNNELSLKEEENNTNITSSSKVTLIFKNLHPTLTSLDLENTIKSKLNDYPNDELDKIITDIRLVVNDEGKSKGYAFVDVTSESIANIIVDKINNSEEKNTNKIICAITKSFDENDDRTIFINNLPYSTNEAEIKSIFSEFGTVIDVRLKRETSNQSSKLKGYGFVEFAKPEVVDNIIKNNKIVNIKGRQIVIKPSKSYNKIKQGIKHVVHISNLEYSVTVTELEEFFRTNDCTMIVETNILKTLNGESKGVALVEFSNEEQLIKAVQLNGSIIHCRPISIKKALSNKIGENINKIDESKPITKQENPLKEVKGSLKNSDFKKMLFGNK